MGIPYSYKFWQPWSEEASVLLANDFYGQKLTRDLDLRNYFLFVDVVEVHHDEM